MNGFITYSQSNSYKNSHDIKLKMPKNTVFVQNNYLLNFQQKMKIGVLVNK